MGAKLNQFIRVQPGRRGCLLLGKRQVAPFTSLSDEDFMLNLKGKVLGQVNLVRFALWHLRAGGSITLTSGVFERPIPGSTAGALTND
jgi:NAD(P)-dependent dehydrogenase (short-subunit alcohol dehydrogenase family)